MQIYSRAPLRLSFAGGGTDVEPYLSAYGGLVLSATINKYVHTHICLNGINQIHVHSLDYGQSTRFDLDWEATNTGPLNLVQATLTRLCPFMSRRGMDIVLRSDVPPGSGLGASSAMIIALVAVLSHWLGRSFATQEVAETAYQIERLDLTCQGGKQDQYAAAMGGFNQFEFYREETITQPIHIPPAILNQLQDNLLLCFTGTTRDSSAIIAAQKANVVEQDANVLQSLHRLKAIALALKQNLIRGQMDDFGLLLDEAWQNKRQMTTQISNPRLDELYETAVKHGALGGKVSGAGGGGYMFFYCSPGRKQAVAQALARLGANAEPFEFVLHGVQVWENA